MAVTLMTSKYLDKMDILGYISNSIWNNNCPGWNFVVWGGGHGKASQNNNLNTLDIFCSIKGLLGEY